MPQKDYRAYASTPRGKAARARAHQKYIEKRRAMRESLPAFTVTPLAQIVSTWRTQ